MIYRAVDCGTYEQPDETPTVAWVGAASYEEAKAKLTALLALTWDATADSVFFTNLWSEIDLERASVQARDAGDRRWLEEGCLGYWPLYSDTRNALVFLNARERSKLQVAAISARAHARELHSCVVAWANERTSERDKAERMRQAQEFLAYANGETRL